VKTEDLNRMFVRRKIVQQALEIYWAMKALTGTANSAMEKYHAKLLHLMT